MVWFSLNSLNYIIICSVAPRRFLLILINRINKNRIKSTPILIGLDLKSFDEFEEFYNSFEFFEYQLATNQHLLVFEYLEYQ